MTPPTVNRSLPPMLPRRARCNATAQSTAARTSRCRKPGDRASAPREGEPSLQIVRACVSPGESGVSEGSPPLSAASTTRGSPVAVSPDRVASPQSPHSAGRQRCATKPPPLAQIRTNIACAAQIYLGLRTCGLREVWSSRGGFVRGTAPTNPPLAVLHLIGTGETPCGDGYPPRLDTKPRLSLSQASPGTAAADALRATAGWPDRTASSTWRASCATAQHMHQQ